MRLLRDEGPRSRTRLSDDTGLSPTTISKAVAPLLAAGWLVESGETTGGVGRPAITISQVPEAVSVCGIQLGFGVARVGIADGWARVRTSRVLTFDPETPVADVLDRVAALAAEVIASDDGPRCIAIGVAAPGPVDAAKRVNLVSLNLGWSNVPTADLLEAKLRLPVFVDHNVRSMALAETRYGGHGLDSIAYVYLRASVSLGLVLGGEPFLAGYHGVSELGHLRVVDGGRICTCGATGCLDTIASEPVLVRRLQELGIDPGTGPEPEVMARIEAEREHPGVEELRTNLLAHLSRGLAVVVNLLNPELIILGGAFATAPDSLLDDLRDGIREEVFPLLRDDVRLARPTIAEAGISAGAAIALEATVYAANE